MKAKDLSPNPENPRKITDGQLKALKKSLDTFGDLSGIIWNRHTKRLCGGHQRLKVIPPEAEIKILQSYAQPDRFGTVAEGYISWDGGKHSYREVEWDEATEKAGNIAANKIGGEFDNKLLADWFVDLDSKNIDLELTGFDDTEIEDVCAPFYNMPEAEDKEEDKIPEPPKNTICRIDDLYRLGNHRLLCGDSTKKENIVRLMAGEKAGMIFTDPPYNFGGETEMHAKSIRPESYGALKESSWDQAFDFDQIIPSLEMVMESGTIYICTSHYVAPKILNWLIKWADIPGYCIWDKTNPMPSLRKRHWTWASELICYGTRGDHIFNFPTEGHAKNVWSFASQTANRIHPTQKPVAIPSHAIAHSSSLNSLIVDLFLGSGSTLIACEKMNRKCYGMEIDPLYCDVILARWAEFTGKDPIREDGIKWSDLNKLS